MRTSLFAFVVVCGTLLPSLPAFGSATSCLGTDSAAAGDPAQLRAVREAVDAGCPCTGFSGAPGQARHDYLTCAKSVVKTAMLGGQLRSQCRALASYPVVRSTCGYGPAKPKVPCIETSGAGKVSCKVTSPTACERAGSVACSDFRNCLDAADTNHDFRVGAGDGGVCNPLVACLNPPLPDGAACDDGASCTKNDTCSGHACGGTAYTCDAPGVCQEAGSCNGDGTCTFPAKPDGTTCDDGVDTRPPLTCTGGTCGACTTAGTCSTTASRSCVVDEHCPVGETCVPGTAPAPRFADNLDGTITDRQTCLVWEKKGAYDGTPVACPGGASCGDPHDADNVYVWSSSEQRNNGPAFTEFIAGLNGAGFAGHGNWRLPVERGVESPFIAPKELESLVDLAAPGCGSGAPCTVASFATDCTASCSPSDPTCSCTAPVATWTATFVDGPNAWSVDFGDGTASIALKTSAGAARAVRGGLPYIDCVGQAAVFQSAINDLEIACFDTCTNPLTLQECIIGCSAGGHALDGLQTTASDACAADPGQTCDAYRVPLDSWCANAPNPPTACVENCFGDTVCEAKCIGSANCAYVVPQMYDACAAENR